MNSCWTTSGSTLTPPLTTVSSATSAAEASRQAVEDAGKVQPIKVTIEPAGKFWVAETYHQDYYKKNPLRYNYYRFSCGRDARLKELWGEPKSKG